MNIAETPRTEDTILERLGALREKTPVGTIWHHLKSGHLYRITGHAGQEMGLSLRVLYVRMGADADVL
jgi:hypothetical protein